MTIGDRFNALFGSRRGAGKLAQAIDPRDAVALSKYVVLYGPNGDAVQRHIKRIERLTDAEAHALDVAWGAAWNVERGAAIGTAWEAAWNAGRGEVRAAAFHAAGRTRVLGAVRGGVLALIIRDIISPAYFDVLVGPWREALDEEPGAE